VKEFLHDRWAGLSHIPELGEGVNARPPGQTWVTREDWRRLTAYRVLQSMRENVRRYWLPPELWAKPVGALGVESQVEYGRAEAEGWREYGHARLLVDTARSLVLGSDQTVVVPDDKAAQDWLTAWAEKEQLQAALFVSEEHSIGDGDSVLTLTWSDQKQRPRVKAWNPGFYFPDLDSIENTPGWEDDFPPVVHLGWDWTEELTGIVRLRQMTWRMVRLDATAPDGIPRAPVPALWGGRREWTCIHSVTDYRLDRLRGDAYSIYTLEPSNSAAEQLIPPTDLKIDFMPLVHVPCTPPGDYHFGASLPMQVAQVLDDLSGSDTDVQATSSESAPPPAVITGAGGAQDLPGGPRQAWWGPEGSSMGYADTSRVLVAGLQQNSNLITHMATNSRLGMALLGRILPSEVPSGFALQLGFAPAQAFEREMRLVRDVKYPLLLKMALRLAQLHEVLPAGDTPVARLDLGSGIPSDIALVLDAVRELLPIGGISTDTAVRWLMSAGVPVEDAKAEVKAIRAESTKKAVELVDALGNTDPAYDWLGIPKPEPDLTDPVLPPATPAPVPPAPNGAPE
jgi:hypothetical protein